MAHATTTLVYRLVRRCSGGPGSAKWTLTAAWARRALSSSNKVGRILDPIYDVACCPGPSGGQLEAISSFLTTTTFHNCRVVPCVRST